MSVALISCAASKSTHLNYLVISMSVSIVKLGSSESFFKLVIQIGDVF